MEKKTPAKTSFILLAEDDQVISQMFATYLSEEGYNVKVAYDGQVTLDILKLETPKVILLDLMMPKISGYDVLEEVKKDPKLKNITIIVFSNLGQEADIKKAKDLGAEDY